MSIDLEDDFLGWAWNHLHSGSQALIYKTTIQYL